MRTINKFRTPLVCVILSVFFSSLRSNGAKYFVVQRNKQLGPHYNRFRRFLLDKEGEIFDDNKVSLTSTYVHWKPKVMQLVQAGWIPSQRTFFLLQVSLLEIR